MSTSAFASQRISKFFQNGEILEDHMSLFLDDGEIVHFEIENTELAETAKLAFDNK